MEKRFLICIMAFAGLSLLSLQVNAQSAYKKAGAKPATTAPAAVGNTNLADTSKNKGAKKPAAGVTNVGVPAATPPPAAPAGRRGLPEAGRRRFPGLECRNRQPL